MFGAQHGANWVCYLEPTAYAVPSLPDRQPGTHHNIIHPSCMLRAHQRNSRTPWQPTLRVRARRGIKSGARGHGAREVLYDQELHERRGQVVSTPVSYSGGPRFEFWLEVRYHDVFSWLSSIRCGKCWNRILKWDTIDFTLFPTHSWLSYCSKLCNLCNLKISLSKLWSNLLFTNLSPFRNFITSVIWKSSLNTLHNQSFSRVCSCIYFTSCFSCFYFSFSVIFEAYFPYKRVLCGCQAVCLSVRLS